MNKAHRILLSTLLCSSILGATSCSNYADTTAKPLSGNVQTETVNLSLSGLTCIVNCTAKVQSSLAKIEGVSTVSVTKESANIVINRNLVSNQQLIKAVQDAGKGFNATVQQ